MPTSNAGKQKKSGGGGGSRSVLREGEKAFVSTTHGKTEHVLIAVKGEGDNAEYRYTGFVSQETPRADKESLDYKAEVRNAETLRVIHTKDGKFKARGGLYYSRQKTFDSMEALKKDAISRLDKLIAREKQTIASRKTGTITQLEAEVLKSRARRTTSAAAEQEAAKTVKRGIQSAADRLAGLEQARARILASM